MDSIVNFLAGVFGFTFFGVPLLIIPIAFGMIALFVSTLFSIPNIIAARRTEVATEALVQKKGILSSFAVFMSCVGGALGMGNIIAGCVSVRLYGPGVLVWILLLGFIISASKFVEVLISCRPKYVLGNPDNNSAKHFNGASFSGPVLYIKDAFQSLLGGKLAYIVSVVFAILFALGFSVVSVAQANQFVEVLGVGKAVGIAVSSVIALMVLFFLLNDMTEITLFSVIFVPLMLCVQLYICLKIVFCSGVSFSSVLTTIFSSAFSGKGAPVQAVIAYAIQRMIFASDLGTGISGMLSSESNVKYRVRQALLSSIEPILTGLVVFMVGFSIVAAGNSGTGSGGVSVMSSSLKSKLDILLFIASIFMFAITTIVTRSYCSVRALVFVFRGRLRLFFIAIMFFCVAVSPLINFTHILTLIDVFLVLAATIHLMAMLLVVCGGKTRALLNSPD